MNTESSLAGSWLRAEYRPVALFSLKSALATSSGGKTVLVPTPFAIKMALLDAAIRARGAASGRELFPQIRDLRVALRVPRQLVVINGFAKIRRPWEAPKSKGADAVAAQERDRAKGNYPWKPTIAYREYVQFGGSLELAFAASAGADAGVLEQVATLLPCINYLGRRGGFIQLARLPEQHAGLPEGYRELTAEVADGYGDGWTLQMLDDCGLSLTFDQVDIYSKDKISMGKGRVLRHVPLPLQLVRSSRSFSLYTRVDVEGRE